MLAKEIDIGVDEDTTPVAFQSVLDVVNEDYADRGLGTYISRQSDEKGAERNAQRPSVRRSSTHNLVLGYQEQIRKSMSNIAHRFATTEHSGFVQGNLNDEFFYFDDFIRMLKEFWKGYRPGGEELDEMEVSTLF